MNPSDRAQIMRLRSKASELKSSGDFCGSALLREESLRLQLDLGAETDEVASSHNYLSILYRKIGDLDRAEVHARRAVCLSTEESPKAIEAKGTYNIVLAGILAERYAFEEAAQFGDEAVRCFSAWHNPPDDFLRGVILRVRSMHDRSWTREE